MKARIRPSVTVLYLAILSLLLLGLVPSAVAKNDKGKICHRTGSDSNPYVVNSPRHGTGTGHGTHPAKNGRSDKDADAAAPKGPTRKSGYGGCESNVQTCPFPGHPDCPLPPPPPPPPCPEGSPACPNGEPVIPPPGNFAGPAPAIAGQPTVTG